MFPTATSRITIKAVAIFLAILLSIVAFLPAARSDEGKQLSIYSSAAVYTLPIVDRSGHEYIGLLELLEPLGRVSTTIQDRTLELRYNAVDAQFAAGLTRARIHGRNFDLTAPFLIENSRGLIPVSSLSTFLPRFIGPPITFRDSARRLFIGDVGVQISFKLDPGTPPKLSVNFSEPVNPTISTEPGKLRMVFKRDPVVSPGSQVISFDNRVISQASYSENNGYAELDFSTSAPLLATFSNDRKTITVSAAAKAVAAGSPGRPQHSVETRASQPPGANENSQRILAVVDPAHGGDERGAALTDTLAEKDVTLGFARLLRHELETRGFAVMMLRDSDTNVALDQRATSANIARAAIYISLHAVSQGTGAFVYTALLPTEGPQNGLFQPWNAAQAPALPVSRIISTAIVAEMQKRQFRVQESSASLRPLNNVLMPAVAIELAPGPAGVDELKSPNYQQRAASAIAEAVGSVRDHVGLHPVGHP